MNKSLVLLSIIVFGAIGCVPNDDSHSTEEFELSATEGLYEEITLGELSDAGEFQFSYQVYDKSNGENWAPGVSCGLKNDTNAVQLFVYENEKQANVVLRLVIDGELVSTKIIAEDTDFYKTVSGNLSWENGLVVFSNNDVKLQLKPTLGHLKPYCTVNSGNARFEIRT
jgi:hypothetical protein